MRSLAQPSLAVHSLQMFPMHYKDPETQLWLHTEKNRRRHLFIHALPTQPGVLCTPGMRNPSNTPSRAPPCAGAKLFRFGSIASSAALSCTFGFPEAGALGKVRSRGLSTFCAESNLTLSPLHFSSNAATP
ncbi:hypothetical protein SKAU_G00261670 [Synaphobranchus kaupii]|uniref:Uncharacterized protein n=1 Tax=Synaphobranchus kaupii TaxID=118154 RepID=A0A9Q1IML3_SYNKA|nr:hypothetical protein SKAU_G00261670 [Synaphobranchus kaupii]